MKNAAQARGLRYITETQGLLGMERGFIQILLLMAALLGGCMKTQNVQFGAIADIQYADKPDAEGRSYSAALSGLEKAAVSLNASRLDFVIQLGDLIDGGNNAVSELKQAADAFSRIEAPRYHVLGNHDFVSLSRPLVMQTLQVPQAYYAFDANGWRFVVLDTLDYAVQGGWPEDSQNLKHACEMLEEARLAGAENAQDYNGAVGLQQLVWLDGILARADSENTPVVLFSHLPLMPPGEKHTAWNADKVVAAIEKYSCVKACFAGHNHAGGYTFRDGIHYVTLEAAVNAAQRGAWAIVSLSPGKIQVRGFGAVTSRTLPLD